MELQADGSGASLSLVFELLWEAQRAGEPVAWVAATPTIFSPVDASECGVDLGALAVVRVRSVVSAARSAERLLRSGGFGVVVLDLGPSPQLPVAVVGKLVKLAQHHDAVVIGLTGARRGASLGAMVSLRMRTSRERLEAGTYRCGIEVLKDKRGGRGWRSESRWTAPPGLR